MEKCSKEINGSVFEILVGDITKQKTDAIVNAANNRLTPGGGVSGAIHRAAGKELWQECKKLGGCETGEAKITKGYNLPAKYVIHTVGPIYNKQSKERNAELLKSCYENSLKLAIQNGIKSISFPAISTGIYGYPMEEAANIAIKTIMDFLKENEEIELVRLVLFSKDAFDVHKKMLDELTE
ncbi:MAG: O-acetyl-ADP-ribose deacetylase [Thermoplasmata archaeon]|nr:MAG: O-acetyl-ADP-ribose deacetylase [Thermoplasmata archaeon]